MTTAERVNPDLIDGSRRGRIARGSGTQPNDVAQLLSQFKEMRKMMQQMGQGTIRKMKKKNAKKKGKGGGRVTPKGSAPSAKKPYMLPGLDPLADLQVSDVRVAPALSGREGGAVGAGSGAQLGTRPWRLAAGHGLVVRGERPVVLDPGLVPQQLAKAVAGRGPIQIQPAEFDEPQGRGGDNRLAEAPPGDDRAGVLRVVLRSR